MRFRLWLVQRQKHFFAGLEVEVQRAFNDPGLACEQCATENPSKPTS